MPTIIEHVSSRQEEISFSDPSAELVYKILGTSDALVARAMLLAERPAAYNALWYQRANLAYEGGGIWTAKAKYGKVQNRFTFRFDFGGEKVKRMYSKRTVAKYQLLDVLQEDEDVADFERAINVTDKVEGVDTVARVTKFSVDWSWKQGTLRADYLAGLMEMIPSTNDMPIMFSWKGQEFYFDANTLLLASGSAGDTSDDGASISLKFEYQPGEEDIEIGNRSGLSKEGQHYMWVRTVESRDQAAGVIRKVPVAAYVEEVYDERPFEPLEIFDLIDDGEEEPESE